MVRGRNQLLKRQESTHFFITEEVNCVPTSVKISLGIPTRLKLLTSASATDSVSIDDSGTASGYLVA